MWVSHLVLKAAGHLLFVVEDLAVHLFVGV